MQRGEEWRVTRAGPAAVGERSEEGKKTAGQQTKFEIMLAPTDNGLRR